jgi:hypothetical protein
MIAEHTVVESYLNQLRDNVRIREVFLGFEARFGHSLEAPGFYTLAIRTRGGHRFPRHGKQATALDELEAWVRAQDLPDPMTWPPPKNWIAAEPPEVPVEVTLYRAKCPPEDDGALRVVLQASGNLEEQRRERAIHAFESKCPKLAAARTPGSTTLLVLESHDTVMSNPVVLAQAAYAAAQGRSDLPDAVICVDTSASDSEEHWMDYPVKNGVCWSDAAQDLPRLPPLNILSDDVGSRFRPRHDLDGVPRERGRLDGVGFLCDRVDGGCDVLPGTEDAVHGERDEFGSQGDSRRGSYRRAADRSGGAAGRRLYSRAAGNRSTLAHLGIGVRGGT